MPVGEMLERISSRELTEWMAYHKIESDDNKRRAMADKAVASVQATKAGRR